ncbi:MAG: AraC family ligand binding domain-containing protein, partial [Burkholderiales bacterium]|nr:AraC family ligand binding domain-containing protein [Opitutaceae bacterium]
MSLAEQLTKEEETRVRRRAEWAARLEAAAAELAGEPERLARARSVGLNRRWPRGHFHPTAELFLQIGGATRFEGPEQRWELAQGRLGLMPRGVPHAETPLDRATPYAMAVACHARAGFTLIRAHAPPDADGARRVIPQDVLPVASERGREAFRYLDEAEQAWAGGGDGRGLAVDFIRVFLQVLAAETRRATSGERKYSPLVEAARVVARSHLAETRLSVEWLA